MLYSNGKTLPACCCDLNHEYDRDFLWTRENWKFLKTLDPLYLQHFFLFHEHFWLQRGWLVGFNSIECDFLADFLKNGWGLQTTCPQNTTAWQFNPYHLTSMHAIVQFEVTCWQPWQSRVRPQHSARLCKARFVHAKEDDRRAGSTSGSQTTPGEDRLLPDKMTPTLL